MRIAPADFFFTLILLLILPPGIGSASEFIDFSETPPVSFGSEDQEPGAYEVLGNNHTLHLSGNTWKKIDLPRTLIPFTLLEFDYKNDGAVVPEISSIGFDNDETPSPKKTFTLYGTENWGLDDFKYYSPSDWKHYKIPAGDIFTGEQDYLVFINDMDAGGSTSSYFRNVLVHDDPPSVTLSFAAFPTQREPETYFGVFVNYNMDLHEYGLKARLFLEIRNHYTGEVLQKYSDDNLHAGYEGPSGTYGFTCSIPQGYPWVYFTAYASPMEFNPYIVDEMLSYPRDGTYPYKWSGNGVTHDINYLGSLIISDNVQGNYCYCSGITYQVFMDAWEHYNTLKGNSPADIFNLTVNQMKSFRSKWYAAGGSIYGAPGALGAYNCGIWISEWDKARRGDLVQIWRSSTSGHSAIFDRWIRNENGEKIKIRYWSTQGSTNGINFNTESYSTINTDDTVFSRPIKPEDNDDWDSRYTDVDTSGEPTRVGDPPDPSCGWFSY